MAGGVVLLVAAIAAFAMLWSGRGAEEASVSELLDRYRASEGIAATDGGFLEPASGVYVYEGTGSEALSVLDTAQDWGPEMPASVTSGDDGCWTWRIEYNTNHWQEQHFCVEGDRLVETGGETFQRFDFGGFKTADVVLTECDPPGDAIRSDVQPGDSWSQECVSRNEQRGTSVTTAGLNTFVGLEELQIDGEPVGAFRYRIERTLTGDQTGTESSERWYSVTDGMPLRVIIDISGSSPSPLGDVEFTQSGDFEISSRTPLR